MTPPRTEAAETETTEAAVEATTAPETTEAEAEDTKARRTPPTRWPKAAKPSRPRRPARARATVCSTSRPCCRETGNLAFLGPPEFAGVELAVQEINEAGGVLATQHPRPGRLRRHLDRHRQPDRRPSARCRRRRVHRCGVVWRVVHVHRQARRELQDPLQPGQHLAGLHPPTPTTTCTSVPLRPTCSRAVSSPIS